MRTAVQRRNAVRCTYWHTVVRQRENAAHARNADGERHGRRASDDAMTRHTPRIAARQQQALSARVRTRNTGARWLTHFTTYPRSRRRRPQHEQRTAVAKAGELDGDGCDRAHTDTVRVETARACEHGTPLMAPAQAARDVPTPGSARASACRNAFSFVATGETSPVLQQAFARHLELIFPDSYGQPNGAPRPSLDKRRATLAQLSVNVISSDVTLRAGVNESYRLELFDAQPSTLTAQTVWGALHGLETFTQLVQHVNADEGFVAAAPVLIAVRTAARTFCARTRGSSYRR